MKALQADGLSQREACTLTGCARSTTQYVSRKEPADAFVGDRLRCLAQQRPRFGWRRLEILLKREGIAMNHKRLRRLYREEGLLVKPRKKDRVPGRGV